MPSSSTAPASGATTAAIGASPIFLIVTSGPGSGGHNVGGSFNIAAHQHITSLGGERTGKFVEAGQVEVAKIHTGTP